MFNFMVSILVFLAIFSLCSVCQYNMLLHIASEAVNKF